MPSRAITLEAVYDQGVLRPLEPLPLVPQQKVVITLELPADPDEWPADVASIYQEIADADRRLAEAMRPTLTETWPACETKP
jgi:predicted DNA-binding antitoxin AbrB/MazE fold protein